MTASLRLPGQSMPCPPQAEAALEAGAREPIHGREAYLGQALYRHRSIFRGTSAAAVWSHLAIDYFRDLVSEGAIRALAAAPQPDGIRLLRAELFLTTPASFVIPPGWRGSADCPEKQVSIEYIHVGAGNLGAYRDAMRDYCGPAATRLVQSGRFGTFQAMETAAALTQAADFTADWNQIHICELDPDGFQRFGPEFEAALRESRPGTAAPSGAFAALDALRTIPRWTFNDVVVERDPALTGMGGKH